LVLATEIILILSVIGIDVLLVESLIDQLLDLMDQFA